MRNAALASSTRSAARRRSRLFSSAVSMRRCSKGSVKYACQASSPAWAPSVPDPRCAGQASGTGNGGVSGAGASDMQPVKTTALRANEAARNLNAGNNGEVGSMVTFRTGIGLKRVWSQRREWLPPAQCGVRGWCPQALLSCLQVLSSPLHLLVDMCIPVFPGWLIGRSSCVVTRCAGFTRALC